ncbi:MAG TPA: c-type cytochrome [Gemmatimonadaceae bacterium]|nr:c-type cytochrome [Gemmatimonadaceae bacterium]
MRTPGTRHQAPGARARTARTARTALAVLLAVGALAACRVGLAESDRARQAAALTGGDPVRGQRLIRAYGCQTCHTIAGVDGADGLVGPPLTGIASRSYIGGVLPNAPANMVRWIQDPKRVDSLTAMPDMGVTPHDARDIAAYLYTLH